MSSQTGDLRHMYVGAAVRWAASFRRGVIVALNGTQATVRWADGTESTCYVGLLARTIA